MAVGLIWKIKENMINFLQKAQGAHAFGIDTRMTIVAIVKVRKTLVYL